MLGCFYNNHVPIILPSPVRAQNVTVGKIQLNRVFKSGHYPCVKFKLRYFVSCDFYLEAKTNGKNLLRRTPVLRQLCSNTTVTTAETWSILTGRRSVPDLSRNGNETQREPLTGGLMQNNRRMDSLYAEDAR